MAKSWIQIQYRIPFRSCYMYCDRIPYFGSKEFYLQKVKVRWIKGMFTWKDSLYVIRFISCWDWDKKQVEKALKNLNKRLQELDKGENYENFLESRCGRTFMAVLDQAKKKKKKVLHSKD